MLGHVMTFLLSIVVSLGVVEYGYKQAFHPASKPAATQRATLKHTWGELTTAQQAAAAAQIGPLDRREVQIFCNVAACNDIAEDIDQVFDMTGAASTVMKSVVDVGSGIGIAPADDVTRKIAAALEAASDGRLKLQVQDIEVKGGGIVVAIGRAPRK